MDKLGEDKWPRAYIVNLWGKGETLGIHNNTTRSLISRSLAYCFSRCANEGVPERSAFEGVTEEEYWVNWQAWLRPTRTTTVRYFLFSLIIH